MAQGFFFGERTGGYVVVDPDEAPAGVPLTSFWRKLVFAWALRLAAYLAFLTNAPTGKVPRERYDAVLERDFPVVQALALRPAAPASRP